MYDGLQLGSSLPVSLQFVGRQSCGAWLFHGLGSAAAVMMGFGATHFSRQVAIHVPAFWCIGAGRGVCA